MAKLAWLGNQEKRKLLQPDRPVSQNFISIDTTKASLNKSLASF